MARAIDVEKAIEIIEEKQKELCPVGRYGRNYVYGSDREKYDAWEEIIDALDNLPTLTPPNELLTLEQLREMDGEPVWVTPLGFWALVIAKPGKRVQLVSNDGETVWADKEIDLVGPIYRRPPEVEK